MADQSNEKIWARQQEDLNRLDEVIKRKISLAKEEGFAFCDEFGNPIPHELASRLLRELKQE